MIRHAACAALALASTLHAAGRHNRDEGAQDVFTPVAFDQQRLGGVLATRMRANVEGYLEKVDPHELIAQPVSAGLFLIAASESYAYNPDPNLKRSVDSVANAIVKNPPAEIDPLGEASLLAGLVAYSEETGRDDTLDAARKLANAHLQNADPVLLGPLTTLYEVTGDERYGNAARSLAGRNPPQEELDRFVFASGLVTYYRETGDQAAMKKSAQLWHTVHPNIAGSPDTGGNTCLTAAWFDWTANLLRATGQAEYANAAETTLYNQILAAQSIQSGAVYGTVTLAGEKQQAAATNDCAAAEGWALAVLPEVLWGRLDNGIAVLNYTSGRASFRLRHRTTVQIYAEGDYPQSGNILLHVEPSRETRFHLLLRVPPEARDFEAEGAGNRLTAKPGQFVDIAADWKKGDTVHITMDLPVIQISDPQQPSLTALKRGPEVLAVTGTSSGNLNSVAWAASSATDVTTVSDQTLQTSGVCDGAPAQLSLMPFAATTGSYRIWLPKH